MSSEEIGRVYGAHARQEAGLSGIGIGLQLIRHISEHVGWKLEISGYDEEGTLVVLDMRSSLAKNESMIELPH